jgi:serine protease Do
VVRDGKRVELKVTVREQPANYGLARGGFQAPGPGGSSHYENLGIEVSPLTADIAEKLGIGNTEGVVITSVRDGSPADLAGLAGGMVIAQVNRKPVKSIEEFRAAMEKQSPEKGILLLVRTAQGARFVMIRSAE